MEIITLIANLGYKQVLLVVFFIIIPILGIYKVLTSDNPKKVFWIVIIAFFGLFGVVPFMLMENKNDHPM